MHPGRRGSRALSLAFGTGLVGLLAGLVLLTVVLVTQGADKANSWATVLGTGVTFVGALVTLVTWWLRQRAAANQPATSERFAVESSFDSSASI